MIRILVGHVLDKLAQLPDESVHCVVTSPPYYGLRDYGVEGQIGLEPSPEAYIERMVEVFREVRRVLRNDGTFWLNIGDSYNGSKSGNTEVHKNPRAVTNSFQKKLSATCKPKDLLGIPWMLAFALRADGWYLRSEIIWAKKAPMPESVTDRPTSAHEKVFLLTKSSRYFYDAEAVKEETSEDTGWAKQRAKGVNTWQYNDTPERILQTGQRIESSTLGTVGSRNLRNWWLLGPEPFPEAHFATFPTEIPRRAILAGTSERGVCPKCDAPWVRVTQRSAPPIQQTERQRHLTEVQVSRTGGTKTGGRNSTTFGLAAAEMPASETIGWRASCDHAIINPIPATVLDPFLGAGTTALVADQLGRDCVGIELSPAYAEMAERRIRRDAGMFAVIDVSAAVSDLSGATLGILRTETAKPGAPKGPKVAESNG